ncbi:MAG: efflux RND transporter periplasmic adaptor subunit [Sphaerochaeta sp.]|uniref:efflux RND transporter periplasmic adaptor subunit n=1 Tax=Sphaerochaeta sp. TaxID=1972642 RepID=UPI003D09AE03
MNSNTSKKRIVEVSVLVILILAATAVIVINPFAGLIEKQKASEPEVVEDATVSVIVQALEPRNLQNVIQGNGNVIDPSSIDVYPEVAGTLTSLLVSVGEEVEKDQIIGTVDPSRAGMVFKESIIKAPASGTVLALPFVQGAMVTAQAPIARLGMLEELEVVMSIAERNIGSVEIGTKARLSFKAFPGKIFTGTVTRLSPVLNPATRTLEIGITVDDPEKQVKSGMFPAVELHTEHLEDVLVVPRSSLLYAGAQSYVYVVDSNNVAHRRNVEIGMQVSDAVQIVSGLEIGDRLVIQGQSLLNDGAVVRIVQ